MTGSKQSSYALEIVCLLLLLSLFHQLCLRNNWNSTHQTELDGIQLIYKTDHVETFGEASPLVVEKTLKNPGKHIMYIIRTIKEHGTLPVTTSPWATIVESRLNKGNQQS